MYFSRTTRYGTWWSEQWICKFRLNQDGGYPTLRPTDNAWEDSHLGEKNGLGAASTADQGGQMDRRRQGRQPGGDSGGLCAGPAEISCLSWTPAPPWSRSTGTGRAPNKMYEMLSKVADVTETLLTSQEVDSRVAVLSLAAGGERSFCGAFFRRPTRRMPGK